MRKFLILFFVCFSLFLGENAIASTNDTNDFNSVDTKTSMEGLICNVLGFLTGGVGKALAAFACIGMSLAFLGGKVSWTLILTFALGMACIFGAPTIIKAFTGGDAACSNVTGFSGK